MKSILKAIKKWVYNGIIKSIIIYKSEVRLIKKIMIKIVEVTEMYLGDGQWENHNEKMGNKCNFRMDKRQ